MFTTLHLHLFAFDFVNTDSDVESPATGRNFTVQPQEMPLAHQISTNLPKTIICIETLRGVRFFVAHFPDRIAHYQTGNVFTLQKWL